MTVKEMAEKYYPKQWNEARLGALVSAGKLTREEADEIIASATPKTE